ncbi:glycosyltransferase [bacterium]|nr:glycosyltransferase [bacterium]
MNPPKNIRTLILIDTARIGGPGKGILQLLDTVCHAQHSIQVATFQSARHKSSEFIQELEKRGHTPIVLYERSRFDTLPIKKFREVLLSGKYDIVQSHGYKAHLYARIARIRVPIIWIAVLNGWTAENLQVRGYHLLDRLNIPYADNIVAVSRELGDYARRVAKDIPINVIPNAVEYKESAIQHQGNGCRNFRLGIIGRLSHEKGHRLLFQALKSLNRFPFQFFLDVVGEGGCYDELLGMVRHFGLEKRVRFLGYQKNLDVIYRSLNLVVMPSLHEGSPNVLLEAMSHGVPVLGANISSLSSIIRNRENGFLFEAGNVDNLSDELRFISTVPSDRLRCISLNARDQIRRDFAPSMRTKRFTDLYQRLVYSDSNEK